jgi:DnaJ-domain-containing protein 1
MGPCRLCRVLEGSSVEGSADAYAILGVNADAKAADIKKRYWRLSLLIHPDKCQHPRAHDAFQAVSKAAKELQVPTSPTPQACALGCNDQK